VGSTIPTPTSSFITFNQPRLILSFCKLAHTRHLGSSGVIIPVLAIFNSLSPILQAHNCSTRQALRILLRSFAVVLLCPHLPLWLKPTPLLWRQFVAEDSSTRYIQTRLCALEVVPQTLLATTPLTPTISTRIHYYCLSHKDTQEGISQAFTLLEESDLSTEHLQQTTAERRSYIAATLFRQLAALVPLR
jgi:hypothetical protein